MSRISKKHLYDKDVLCYLIGILTIFQEAMQVIKLSEHEQNEILKMLAIILWLGNVQFQEDDSGNSSVADTGVTDFVAYLMEVDPEQVQKVLTARVMETTRGGRRGSIYDVPLNPAQATSGRDALAKAIYNNLFEWIVSRVNVSMKMRSAHSQIIGILVRVKRAFDRLLLTNSQDIFGFEIFEVSHLPAPHSVLLDTAFRTTHSSSFVSIMSTRNYSKYLLS